MKQVLEPLAIANNVAQSGHCRLDHITLTLGNLYRIYSNPELNHVMRQKILGSLEKRWAAADQDIFILAVFFNPYVRQPPFSTSILTHAQLFNIAKRTYTRFNQSEPDLDFLKAFVSYYNNEDDYSKDRMELEMLKQAFDKEVC